MLHYSASQITLFCKNFTTLKFNFLGGLQFFLSLIIFVPVLTLFFISFGDAGDIMQHLFDTVIFSYFDNTIRLMFGVAAVTLLFGITTAWIVSRYEFFGKAWLEWMLVLPAAMPAYIVAYTYTDFFEYAGPVQGLWRYIWGYQSALDYHFPEVRSLGGAILLMGAVLYPYVYITTRTAFYLTSRRLFEAAQMAGGNMFTSIALPLARPAIVAGVALAMMEVVSDFGTVEYFAIDTLTLGVFNVWLGMNNIVAASRIALMAFVLVLALLALELWGRRGHRFNHQSTLAGGVPSVQVRKMKAVGLALICLVPILLGFIIPFLILINAALLGGQEAVTSYFFKAVGNTVLAAFLGSVVIISITLVIAIIAHYKSGTIGQGMALMGASGYAVPGTILALGILGCVIGVNAFFKAINSSLVLGSILGSLPVLIFAYLVRFQAVGYGALKAGISRIPPNSMPASQVMGYRFLPTVVRVISPQLKASILAGLLLVFVDIMKELPMTLLLRPFNFETLATLTYQFASDEALEEAALPALMIVIVGIIPVIIINKTLVAKNKIGAK